MEDTVYLPVALFLPGIALLGILVAVIGTMFVVRRRRRHRRPATPEEVERVETR